MSDTAPLNLPFPMHFRIYQELRKPSGRFASAATPEWGKRFGAGTSEGLFILATPDGSSPPGALVVGLSWDDVLCLLHERASQDPVLRANLMTVCSLLPDGEE